MEKNGTGTSQSGRWCAARSTTPPFSHRDSTGQPRPPRRRTHRPARPASHLHLTSQPDPPHTYTSRASFRPAVPRSSSSNPRRRAARLPPSPLHRCEPRATLRHRGISRSSAERPILNGVLSFARLPHRLNQLHSGLHGRPENRYLF